MLQEGLRVTSVFADMPHSAAVAVPYVHAELPVGASQNVIDKYKGWTAEAIKADLDTLRGQMVNVFQNLANDFNKATALRTHNAMGGKLVIFTGKRKVDRRGMVGQHHYTHAAYIEDTVAAVKVLIEDGYTVYPVDNSPWMNPRPIQEMQFPEKSAFVYGEEGLGLSQEVVQACNGNAIFLVMAGSVRSLNVASCAAMVMFHYSTQHPLKA